jgi:hypothetical protein
MGATESTIKEEERQEEVFLLEYRQEEVRATNMGVSSSPCTDAQAMYK